MLKRYTETKLEKIVNIGFARIDQIIDKACDDLDQMLRNRDEAERKIAQLEWLQEHWRTCEPEPDKICIHC